VISTRHRPLLPWLAVAFGWLVSQGLSLLYPRALFWDDWLFYTGNSIDFSESGTRDWCCWPKSEIENFLLDLHPGSFRVLTFIIFPLVAYAAWRIAGYFVGTMLTRREQHVFALLVLFLPANSARITNITFSYSLSLLSFMAAAWLWIRLRHIAHLIVAVPLFLFSFRTSSLLVFALVPALLGLLVDRRERRLPETLVVVRAALPVTLAVGYRFFVSDNAVQEGYNEFQFGGVARAALLFFALAVLLGALVTARHRLQLSSRALTQLGAGLFVLWLGAMPYMVVGHLSSISDWTVYFLPGEGDWHSRHQLLLPFGLALSIIGFWNLLEGKAMTLLAPLTIAMSLLFNFLYSVEYFVDARKQDAVIQALRADPDIRESKVVYLQDDSSTAKLNARSRQYREYEFDGQLKRALGAQAPLFFDESQVSSETCLDPVEVPVYKSFAPVSAFTKFQVVLGRPIDITLERSAVLACLKPEFRP